MEAMRSCLELANRYPGAECDSLTEKIAAFHDIRPEQVTLGAGFREILRMAAAPKCVEESSSFSVHRRSIRSHISPKLKMPKLWPFPSTNDTRTTWMASLPERMIPPD
jgi:histidinol-phosphate/aromatic aminotransferase/cobyric acid decarboxylase-like protein